MRASSVFISLALLVGTACQEQTPDPTASSEAPVATQPAEPVQQQPAAPRPAPEIDEKQARALLDTWVNAQNESEFAAYSALYADRFEGIKRVGPKTSKYDREGWLKDRERMFAKKVIVTADDVKVSSSTRTAVLTFVQTWQSGTFKDVGPKQIVLARDGDKLLIAREEMLASTVDGARSDAHPYEPASAALVVGDGQFYVLDPNPGDIGQGDIRPNKDGFAPTRAVDPARLGPHAEWKGKSVEVFGTDGEPCRAKIAEVVLFGRVTPHFGDVGFWKSENKSPQFIAKQIWQMAEGRGIVLAGRLDKSCKGGVWGHPQGAKTTPVAGTPADAALTERALEALTTLPAFAPIQKEYGQRSLWYLGHGAKPSVTRFGDHVATTAVAGPGCGGFYGALWAIWQVRGDQLVLVTDGKNPEGLFHPAASFMQDGKVSFVGDNTLVQPVGPVLRPTHHARVPFLDCSC